MFLFAAIASGSCTASTIACRFVTVPSHRNPLLASLSTFTRRQASSNGESTLLTGIISTVMGNINTGICGNPCARRLAARLRNYLLEHFDDHFDDDDSSHYNSTSGEWSTSTSSSSGGEPPRTSTAGGPTRRQAPEGSSASSDSSDSSDSHEGSSVSDEVEDGFSLFAILGGLGTICDAPDNTETCFERAIDFMMTFEPDAMTNVCTYVPQQLGCCYGSFYDAYFALIEDADDLACVPQRPTTSCAAGRRIALRITLRNLAAAYIRAHRADVETRVARDIAGNLGLPEARVTATWNDPDTASTGRRQNSGAAFDIEVTSTDEADATNIASTADQINGDWTLSNTQALPAEAREDSTEGFAVDNVQDITAPVDADSSALGLSLTPLATLAALMVGVVFAML